MRRVLMSALAAAVIATASPAFATATLHDQNGADLNTKIYASQDDISVAPNVGNTVYANTSVHAGHDVTFYGFTNFNQSLSIAANVAAFGTTIDIKDGGGFAQLNDHDFDSHDAATQNLFAVIMDPAPAFTAYEFSIMLGLTGNDTATLYVYYMLTGGSSWIQSLPVSGLPTGGSDNQFILNGLLPGQSFDKILIASNSAIFQIKQNSIDTVLAAVPEPATWTLMLLGFGGMGMALRRGRKQNGRLLQIA